MKVAVGEVEANPEKKKEENLPLISIWVSANPDKGELCFNHSIDGIEIFLRQVLKENSLHKKEVLKTFEKAVLGSLAATKENVQKCFAGILDEEDGVIRSNKVGEA